MLDQVWRQARAWAAEARGRQREASTQALLALLLACGAALLAAIAAALGTVRTTWSIPEYVVTTASIVSGVAAASGAVFGRHILDTGTQARWIAARSAAEAMQSECYRFAAHIGRYKDHNAASAFSETIDAIINQAETKNPTPVGAGTESPDRPPPPDAMPVAWYIANRLQKQRDWYEQRSREHSKAAQFWRRIGLGLGAVGGGFGVLGAVQLFAWLAPFVAATTTVAASIAAFGAVDRKVFLASGYAGTGRGIDRLLMRHGARLISDEDLIAQGEDLLSAEYRAWADRNARPPARATGPEAVETPSAQPTPMRTGPAPASMNPTR